MGWLARNYDQRLQPASAGDVPPTYDAYTAFKQGMDRYILVDNRGALDAFSRAAAADTSFVEAQLYESIALSNLQRYREADSLLQAVDAHRQRMSEYYRLWLDYRKAFVRGHRDSALVFVRAIAHQSPGSKADYNHAVEAFQNGYLREARGAIDSLSPDRGAMLGFAPYWTIKGAILHAQGDYARELAAGITAVTRYHYADVMWQWAPIVRALAARGNVDSLFRVLDSLRMLPPDRLGNDYWGIANEAAEELRAHGHSDEARGAYNRALIYVSQRADNLSRFHVARVQYALGQYSESDSIIAGLRRADERNVDYIGLEGLDAAREGRAERARAISDSLLLLRQPYDFGLASVYRARIAAVLGDRDGAVNRLREAFSQGQSYDLWLHRTADFEGIRGYGPFKELVKSRD
jgi:tetratricopeptide (TPR) repeat protein